MASNAWAVFDSFREFAMDGTCDMDGDTFKIALIDSVVAPLVGTHDTWSDLSANEITTGNGYVANGDALAGVTWVKSGAIVTFDATDHVWTASGGSIPPSGNLVRYAVIYDDTVTTPVVDPLVAFSLLDNAPADVPTVTNTNTLTVTFHANGVFQLT